MATPFKYLDAYTKKDKASFFGRNPEINRLHQEISTAKLVLLYGPLGSGKSSLVHCGLANKFRDADWLPIVIHRGKDLMDNLVKALKKANKKKSGQSGSIMSMVKELHSQHGRPVYLIFDHFEELLINGDPKEQQTFFQEISGLIQSTVASKVLIVIQEEYLAQLSNFEKIIPELFKHRVRLEEMGDAQLQEVIEGVGRFPKITIEDSGNTIPEMLKSVQVSSKEATLPRLQLYLDKLYRQDEIRKAARGEDRNIQFDPELVTQHEAGENIIWEFISGQIRTLHAELEAKEMNPGAVGWEILFALVHPKTNTRLQLPKSEIETLLHEQKGIEAKTIHQALSRLIELKLIREESASNGNPEVTLVHDLLVNPIQDYKLEEGIAVKKAKELLHNSYEMHRELQVKWKLGKLLTKSELGYLVPFLKRMNLRPDIAEYVEESQRVIQGEDEAERKNIEGVLEEQITAKDHEKRRFRLALIVAGVCLVAAAAMGVLFMQAQQGQATIKAELNQVIADQLAEQRADSLAVVAKYEGFLNEGIAHMGQGEYEPAMDAFTKAMAVDSTRSEAKDSLEVSRTRLGVRTQFDKLVKDGNYLNRIGNWPAARVKGQQALELNYGNDVANTIIANADQFEQDFAKLSEEGDVLFAAGTISQALDRFQQALKLKPSDADLQQKVQACQVQLGAAGQ